MKSFLSKNKKLLAISLIGLFILSSGVAFAYTSQDWVTKATAWANSNCKNPTGASSQNSFMCFLWSKSVDQQHKIDSINTKLASVPVLVDAKGKELGVPISAGAFYNTQFKRNIYYGTGILGKVHDSELDDLLKANLIMYFDNPDCTGKAYLGHQNQRVYTWVHAIHPPVAEGQSQPDWIKYYIVPNSASKEDLASAKSSFNEGGCQPFEGVGELGYKAQEIQLPFDTLPMALPLRYK